MSDADENQTGAELERYLPRELSERGRLVELSRRHLALLAEVNESLNLTAITSPHDAVIKHVVDSVVPVPALRGARVALDVGSGAGFPGIPLAIACPATRFILSESVLKKARFLEQVVRELGLSNAEVYAGRAETWLQSSQADAVVVRAVASTRKLLMLLGPVRSHFRQLLLYKGPAGDQELAEASDAMTRFSLRGEVALRYALPGSMGRRSVLRFE